MKIQFLILLPIILLTFLYTYGCKKETQQQEYIVSDTTKISTSLKGWDLYSWQVGDEWYYSILYGTNRLKTPEEIQFITSSSAQIAKLNSLDNLKKILSKLAASENIMWYACLSGSLAFSLPSETVVNDVKQFCTDKQLILSIRPCNP